MASERKFADIKNTGYGSGSGAGNFRLTNKDGSTNLKKTGLPVWSLISIYHTLLRMTWGKFLLCAVIFYTFTNILFASIYCAIGIEHLDGAQQAGTFFDHFLAAFFFSSQTLTTVGYGHVAPDGIVANIVASMESLIGILSFAVVTGLIYGRFARPRAYLLFSNNMLIAPHKGNRALMIRTATYKNNHLTDAEAMLTVALQVIENGRPITRFYQLPLELNKINSLALNWTIVHPLDESSPLQHYTYEELIASRLEVIVSIKGFDDHFSNTVQQRTSYTHNELVYGARFLPMYHVSADGIHTILELNKINAYENVSLPEPVAAV